MMKTMSIGRSVVVLTAALILGGCAGWLPAQESNRKAELAVHQPSARAADDDERAEALKLAHLLRDNGRMQAAWAVYQRMDRKGQLSGSYLLEYASVAALVRPPQETLALFSRARKALGDNIDDEERLMIALGTGRARLAMGLSDLAAEDFKAALELEPENAQALNALGIIASLRGDNKKAQARFQQVLKADPGFAPALNNLALAYLAENNSAQAIRLLTPAARHGDITLQLNLALAYVLADQPEAARTLLATRLQPDYVQTVIDNFIATRARIAAGAPAAHELMAASQQPLALKDQE